MRGRSREAECRARLVAAAGRDISDEEFEEIMDRVQTRAKQRPAGGGTQAQAATAAARDEAIEARIKALLEKRNRVRSILAERAALARIPEAHEDVALMAMMEGRIRQGRAYGLSAPAEGHALAHQLKGALELDLRRAGVWDRFKQHDPVFEREVTRERWNLAEPETPGKRATDPQARTVAEILDRHDETRRLMKNQAGAWISKIDNYVGRQTHDMWKIRGGGKAADYAAWRDLAAQTFNERTFDGIKGDEREPFLKALWDRLASGEHDISHGADWLGGFKGPGNVAKRLSQERVIHFKDADSYFDYNERFGRGPMLATMVQAIDHDARNIALMNMFSNNPEDFIQKLAKKLAARAIKRGDLDVSDKLKPEKIQDAIDVLNGRGSIPHNLSLAMVAGTMRNLEVVWRLGRVVLSSFPDIVANAGTLRRNGIPYFESIPRQIMGLLPGMTSAERRELGIELGAWTSGILGDVHMRFRAEDSRFGTSWSQRMSDFMFKANLQYYWNDRLRSGEARMLTSRYARYQSLPFAELPALVRATLNRYDIGEPEWQALRQVARRAADGHDHLMPAEIAQLPDEAVAHLGPSADAARRDLHTKYGTLIDDQVSEGISDPTAQQRRMMRFGAAGTWKGETANAMLQFKSFALTFLMRSVGRELTRGDTPMFGGRLNVDVPGLVKLMTGITLFGAFGVMAKDLVRGKDPLERFAHPEGLRDFTFESLAQGGGFGIFGDYLFGKNTWDRTLADVVSGPIIGSFTDVGRMMLSLRDGIVEEKELEKLPSQALRFAQQHTPYANLFYLDLALKHLFFYDLQDKANPGYLRRMEQRARQHHEAYWLRPTEAARH